MPRLKSRIDRPELMDTVEFEPAVVQKTLAFLGMTARHFGGARVITSALDRWSGRWPANRTITILDVGTGGGEIPVALVAWARSRGHRLKVTALDLVPSIADIAAANTRRCPDITVRCANVFDLSARGERFDYVCASLFLHHIPDPRVVEILRLFDSLATRGLIVSDLTRSVASFWAIKVLAYAAGNHVVRHDAPLSVQRAFTPAELRHFAAQAGLSYLRVRQVPLFRLSLEGEKV